MRWENRKELNKLQSEIYDLKYGVSWKKLFTNPSFWSSLAAIIFSILAFTSSYRELLITIQKERLLLAEEKFEATKELYEQKILTLSDSTKELHTNLHVLLEKEQRLKEENYRLNQENSILDSKRKVLREEVAEERAIKNKSQRASFDYRSTIISNLDFVSVQNQLHELLAEVLNWEMNNQKVLVNRFKAALQSIDSPNEMVVRSIKNGISEIDDFEKGRPFRREEFLKILNDIMITINTQILIESDNAQKREQDESKYNHYDYSQPFADDTIK